ncbi:MAG: thiamine pyrophosphate-dependent enzyme, partial [Alphaproteobacteria bacterium]|nr:thiamine pyrophosphate-dependent enzyme [Alphaproteobacteria bacterium]
MEKNHLVEDDQLIDLTTFKQEVLKDYEICLTSREVSFQGRKEVLGGKAKFGIFGSGIELPQVVMAKFFKKGDWKSGYYRDQTFAFALELSSLESYFAQLYADSKNDPFSGGRQMNAHFATRNIDDEGNIINLVEQYNIAADLAPTAGQVTHALGLALASKCFKNSWDCDFFEHLSDQGQEVCFCTIGDASTSEGQFWETVNAAGVLKIPLAIFVWDNGYGISVPIELQTVKASISEALKGMGYYNNIINEHETGILIYKIKGWDYSDLCQQIAEGIHLVRTKGVPAIFHIEELTQPHGHSTSGSQERYKSKERLDWEKNWDCILKMEEWILANKIAEPHEIDTLKQLVKNKVMEAKNTAWVNYQNTFKHTIDDIIGCFNNLQFKTDFNFEIAQNLLKEIIEHNNYSRSFILHKLSLIIDLEPDNTLLKPLIDFRNNYNKMGFDSYNKNLYYEGNKDKTISHFEASELTYNNPKIQLKN